LNTQKQIFLIVVLFFAFTGACAAYTAIDLPIRAEDQEQWHFEESVERGASCSPTTVEPATAMPARRSRPQLNREEFRNQGPDPPQDQQGHDPPHDHLRPCGHSDAYVGPVRRRP
jgi:hypothetical protein